MDPITGIGLVASVIQLVQFGVSTVKVCRELSEKGSTAEHADLQARAGHLANLTVSLQESWQQAVPPSGVLTGAEQDLANLARKCEDCALRLKHEVEKYHLPSKRSSLTAAKMSLRLIFKGGGIDKLHKRFQQYQDTLQVSLLHRLSQKFEVHMLVNDKRFSKLDHSLQDLIQGLASQQTSLGKLVKDESKSTREHIDTVASQIRHIHLEDRLQREDERWYDELTRSLFYPEISSRQEQIEEIFEGIENSYDWIFDEPPLHDNASPKWTNFSQWLKSGNKVYWINGKAGAGKSTLMSRICSHERTQVLLQEWSCGKQLLIPTHFFWNAGSRLQRSIDGLLRPLIYQLLTKCRSLARCVERQTLHLWTEKRLLELLSILLMQTLIPIQICIFLDGLDEYEGDSQNVVKTLQGLANQKNVKICLSSRPLLYFEREFANAPYLKLQDLTFDTIQNYAKHQLLDIIQEHFASQKVQRKSVMDLLRAIVHNANGVFLWAVIATRTLRDGLKDYANLDELEMAVNSLPDGIDDLYFHILKRIKPAYKREAIRFLRIIFLHGDFPRDCDICAFSFIDLERTSTDAPLTISLMDPDAVAEQCARLKMRIYSHTLGLLDVVPDRSSPCRDSRTHLTVVFHHRTVRDFLLASPRAQELIALEDLEEHEIRLSIVRGILRHVAFENQQHIEAKVDWTFINMIFAALKQLVIVEDLTGRSQSQLMRSIDRYIFIPPSKNLPFGFGPGNSTSEGEKLYSIDLIALAADAGMWRYVCDILDIDHSMPSNHPKKLLDVQQYHSTERVGARMFRFSDKGEDDAQPFQYRQHMSECLSWVAPNPSCEFLPSSKGDERLLSTYQLYFYRPSVEMAPPELKLIGILLQAGADPMAELKTPSHMSKRECPCEEHCFWSCWLLEIFEAFVDDNAIKNEDHAWQITKLLLASGADINYRLPGSSTYWYDKWNVKLILSRRGEVMPRPWRVEGETSAMYVIATCFGHYPECRDFAAIAAKSIRRPWRKIYAISKAAIGGDGLQTLRLHDDETELLWDLIEAWEESGEQEDWEQARRAVTEIWTNRYADIIDVPNPNFYPRYGKVLDSNSTSDADETESEAELRVGDTDEV